MKKINFFILLIFLNFGFFADTFQEITNLDKTQLDFIQKDFSNLNYLDYLTYYCFVSEESEKYNEDFTWFENLETKIDKELMAVFKDNNIKNLNKETQKDFADKLLGFLHDLAFKNYFLYADRISQIISKGEFNCVSSSILYSIFLKKYGFNFSVVETSDHVFIKVIFNYEIIDVETTTKFGFDPGKKKEVLDNFGKLTGFSYVPQKNYHERNDINFKKLLLLVSHNIANSYQSKNNYLPSVKLAYFIYKGRNDPKGNEDFYSYFNNYIVYFANNKQYLNALELINSYLDNIDKNINFLNLRFDVIMNYINSWQSYDDFENYKIFLQNENIKFNTVKDDQRFIKIFFLLYYKYIDYLMKKNNFNKCYSLIQEFNTKYQYADVQKLFENVLYNQIEYLNKVNAGESAGNNFAKLKLDFTNYEATILKHEMIYYNNTISTLLSKKDFQNALDQTKIIYSKYKDQYLIKNLLLNCYVNYTISIYEKKDLTKLIKYCDESLTYFPNDKTLTNNYSAFLKNFINEELSNKNYSKARNILKIAQGKFPQDSYFKRIDSELASKNY